MASITADHIEVHRSGEAVRLGRGTAWTLGVVGLLLAAAGAAAAGLLGWGESASRSLFFHAYLVAFASYLSITLGALCFVLLQHLTRAAWSVTVRRAAEAVSGNFPLLLLLAVPLALEIPTLYPWATPEGAAEHAVAAKAAYLAPGAMLGRLGGCFAVWIVLTWLLRRWSIRQDGDGQPGWSSALERLSAPGMLAFALTVFVAATDLLMSLSPGWYSTIYSVYFFSGSVLAGTAAVTLAAVWLRRRPGVEGLITIEHLHDLGKLCFGFVVFWGYIAFSQYVLIWYANLPEEAQYYQPRQLGPWIGVSLALVACQLFIPFVGLLSRWPKRRPAVLAFWAVWILAAHVLDLFWLVMPNVFIRQMPSAAHAHPGEPLPEVLAHLISNRSIYELSAADADLAQAIYQPLEPRSVAIVAALVVAMGGLYLANTVRLLGRASAIPARDPRMAECLAAENE